jgi:hypothetical protein
VWLLTEIPVELLGYCEHFNVRAETKLSIEAPLYGRILQRACSHSIASNTELVHTNPKSMILELTMWHYKCWHEGLILRSSPPPTF